MKTALKLALGIQISESGVHTGRTKKMQTIENDLLLKFQRLSLS